MAKKYQLTTTKGEYIYPMTTSECIVTNDNTPVVTEQQIDDKLNGISLWKGTQAEYDAIQNKDENTLYIIKE